jgi:dienelactone hydrolase
VAADIYHPGTGGRHGGVVLQLGARLVRRDPVLERFAEGLARSGVVVLVPESSNLLAGRVLGEERDAIRRAYELLLSQPDVDAARTGLVGFSVGGALCIVAAAQAELRDRVPFVYSFGGYYDASQLMVDVGSRSVEVEGHVVPWDPSALTLAVMAQQIVETLPDAHDQALLTRFYLSHEAVEDGEWTELSPTGQGVRELLAGTTRERARSLVRDLPASGRERLATISPSTYLPDLRTRLYLMHDTGDTFIPFTHTRELAANAPLGVLKRYSEFSIFQHVYPDRPVPWQTFLPDLWALYWFSHAVLLELL